jgi:Tfp pilus assembly protein PilN
MKQQINLLDELPKKKPDIFKVDMMKWIFPLFFVLLMMIYGLKVLMGMGLSKEVARLTEVEKKLTEQAEAMKKNFPEAAEAAALEETTKKLEQEVEKRSRVVAILTKKRAVNVTGFSGYLLALSKQIPSDVWLDKIQIQKGGEDIQLFGSAMSNSSLAQFTQNLSRDGLFKDKDFEVVNIKKSEGDDKAVVDFLLGTQNRSEVEKLS